MRRCRGEEGNGSAYSAEAQTVVGGLLSGFELLPPRGDHMTLPRLGNYMRSRVHVHDVGSPILDCWTAVGHCVQIIRTLDHPGTQDAAVSSGPSARKGCEQVRSPGRDSFSDIRADLGLIWRGTRLRFTPSTRKAKSSVRASWRGAGAIRGRRGWCEAFDIEI